MSEPPVAPAPGFPPAEEIATARLRLTPLGVDDAAEMAGVLADPALYVHIGGEPPSVDGLRERYRRMATGRPPAGDEWWLNWVVRERGDGAAVGTVQATVRGQTGAWSADLAWVVGVPWQGRGYATEAAAGMVRWLGAHGVATLAANIHPENRASEAVAARLGLAPAGQVEDGERVWRDTLGRAHTDSG